MHRRHFLGVAAASLFSGCGQTDTVNSDRSPSPTTTQSTRDSPTSTDVGKGKSAETPTSTSEQLSVTFPRCNLVRVDAEQFDTVFVFQADGDVSQYEEGYTGQEEFSVGETIKEVTVYAPDTVQTIENPGLNRCENLDESNPETKTEEAATEAGPKQATDELDRATDALADAADAFVEDSAPGQPLYEAKLDVDIDPQQVREPLYSARDYFNDAESYELSAQQQQRLSRLRGVYWLLWWLPTVHGAAQTAPSKVESNWVLTATGPGDAPGAITTLEDELDQLKADSDPEDMRAHPSLTVDEYERTLSQYQTIADELNKLVGDLREYGEARELFNEAMNQYDAEKYDEAVETFGTANADFETNAGKLQNREFEQVTEILDTARCYSDGMVRRSDEYQSAAQAGVDGDRTRRIVREEELMSQLSVD